MILTILFWLNLIVWAALAGWMLPGAISAFRARARHGDPMRLGVFLVCVLMLGGVARWLWAPQNLDLLSLVLIWALGTGSFIAWAARSYGRGPHVGR